jgi:hypothetical protein
MTKKAANNMPIYLSEYISLYTATTPLRLGMAGNDLPGIGKIFSLRLSAALHGRGKMMQLVIAPSVTSMFPGPPLP